MPVSQQLKTTKELASKLLDQIGFESYFSQFGEINFVGSFALDLMVVPDIDVHISVENLTRQEIVKLCFDYFSDKEESLRSMFFGDHHNFKTSKGFPDGFYFGLTAFVDSVKFKIDIWFVKDDFTLPETQKYQKLLEEKPELRNKILEFKNQALDNGVYLYGLSGKIIYDAVLIEKIEDFEDLKKYAKIVSDENLVGN